MPNIIKLVPNSTKPKEPTTVDFQNSIINLIQNEYKELTVSEAIGVLTVVSHIIMDAL